MPAPDTAPDGKTDASSRSNDDVPLSLQERIGPNDRYEILGQVNSGNDMTAWVAQDHKDNHPVRIELYPPSHSRLAHAAYVAFLEHLNHITTLPSVSSTPHPFIQLTDSFLHHTSHGTYPALVLRPPGPSLSDLVRAAPRQRLPTQIAKDIILQIIDAVTILHQLDISHLDLNLGSIFIATEQASDKKRRWQLKEPLHVVLAGFGQAKSCRGKDLKAEEKQELADEGWEILPPSQQTDHVMASLTESLAGLQVGEGLVKKRVVPEEMVGRQCEFAADKWAVGCLIINLFAGKNFTLHGSDQKTRSELFETDAEQSHGGLPDSRGDFPIMFGQDRRPILDSLRRALWKTNSSDVEMLPDDHSEDKILSEADMEIVASCIEKLLCLDPSERAQLVEVRTTLEQLGAKSRSSGGRPWKII